jgi:hypothetical protein
MSGRRGRRTCIYRVISEEEYLAGADPFAEAGRVPAGEPHGRRLRRFAGAAALTGAMGTVGGVGGLAILHAHAPDRKEVAERLRSSMRTAARRRRTGAGQVRRRHVSGRSRSRRGLVVGRTPMGVTRAMRLRMQAPTRALALSAPQASAAQSAPAAVRAGTQAQSEFGFER